MIFPALKIMEQSNETNGFKESLEIFYEALHIDPTNDELQKQYLYFIARVYKSMTAYDSAIEFSTKALKIDPKFSLALLERAKSLYECRLYAQALRDVRKSIKFCLASSEKAVACELRDKLLDVMSVNDIVEDDQSSCSSSVSDNSLDDQNAADDSPGEVEMRETNVEPPSPAILYESKRFSALMRVFSAPVEGNLFEEPLQPKSAFATGFNKAKEIAEKFVNYERSQQQKNREEMQAEVKNAKGCRELSGKHFDSAIGFFSEAISLSPENAVYLANRSECYVETRQFKLALADALKAISIDQMQWKSYSIAMNSSLSLGDIKTTESLIRKFKKFIGIDSIKFNEIPKLEILKQCEAKIEKLYLDECFNDCLKQLQEARKIAKACDRYQEMTLMCLILSHRFSIVDELIATELRKNPSNKNIPFMQALNCYYQCQLEESIDHFEMCLKPGYRVKEASEYLDLADRMLEVLNSGK